MYIVQTKVLDRFNYYLSTFKGKQRDIVFWSGLKDNAKKFYLKSEAQAWAFAETTLKTEIIPA